MMRPGDESEVGEEGEFPRRRARGEAIKLSGGASTRAALHSTAQRLSFSKVRRAKSGRRSAVGGSFGRV